MKEFIHGEEVFVPDYSSFGTFLKEKYNIFTKHRTYVVRLMSGKTVRTDFIYARDPMIDNDGTVRKGDGIIYQWVSNSLRSGSIITKSGKELFITISNPFHTQQAEFFVFRNRDDMVTWSPAATINIYSLDYQGTLVSEEKDAINDFLSTKKIWMDRYYLPGENVPMTGYQYLIWHYNYQIQNEMDNGFKHKVWPTKISIDTPIPKAIS